MKNKSARNYSLGTIHRVNNINVHGKEDRRIQNSERISVMRCTAYTTSFKPIQCGDSDVK